MPIRNRSSQVGPKGMRLKEHLIFFEDRLFVLRRRRRKWKIGSHWELNRLKTNNLSSFFSLGKMFKNIVNKWNIQHGFFPDGENFLSAPNRVLTAHSEWLPGVETEAFSTTCAVYGEDCEGWWLPGGRSLVAEHWQLKPEALGSISGDCWLFTFFSFVPKLTNYLHFPIMFKEHLVFLHITCWKCL